MLVVVSVFIRFACKCTRSSAHNCSVRPQQVPFSRTFWINGARFAGVSCFVAKKWHVFWNIPWTVAVINFFLLKDGSDNAICTEILLKIEIWIIILLKWNTLHPKQTLARLLLSVLPPALLDQRPRRLRHVWFDLKNRWHQMAVNGWQSLLCDHGFSSYFLHIKLWFNKLMGNFVMNISV